MPYIQQNVHMMLDDEAFRTIEHVDNSLYVQEAVRKVVAGMLEISSAYMYNDAIRAKHGMLIMKSLPSLPLATLLPPLHLHY